MITQLKFVGIPTADQERALRTAHRAGPLAQGARATRQSDLLGLQLRNREERA
jgi:hypothetical protein